MKHVKSWLQNWGAPVGMLAAWGIAAAWTISSLVSMQTAQLPVVPLPPVVITADRNAS